MAHTAKKQARAAGARRRSSTAHGGQSSDVEGTALVALHAMTRVEMARATKALETEGIRDVRPARIILSRMDAKRVASGSATVIKAAIVPGETVEVVVDGAPGQALDRALKDARARGESLKDQLLGDPEMLSTADMAEGLGMSEEGIRLKRKRHEVLGLDFARRGIRYPSWQLLENRQLLPAIPRLFSILGDSPWTVYRFLLQRHPELGGARALDALKRGRIDGVLAVAENTTSGAFS
jgi:hypothetical protein